MSVVQGTPCELVARTGQHSSTFHCQTESLCWLQSFCKPRLSHANSFESLHLVHKIEQISQHASSKVNVSGLVIEPKRFHYFKLPTPENAQIVIINLTSLKFQ